jgi:hypothetical protein
MIEKLKILEVHNQDNETVQIIPPTVTETVDKINEIIETVNRLQKDDPIDWDRVKNNAKIICKNCGEIRAEHSGREDMADLGCEKFEAV